MSLLRLRRIQQLKQKIIVIQITVSEKNYLTSIKERKMLICNFRLENTNCYLNMLMGLNQIAYKLPIENPLTYS